jgi:hypothetical protein
LFEQVTHFICRDEWSEIVAEVNTTLRDEQNRWVCHRATEPQRVRRTPGAMAYTFMLCVSVSPWQITSQAFATLAGARPYPSPIWATRSRR